MHPARSRGVAGRAGLRHLVFVVGEAQIQTAAVNVEAIAQVTVGHGGAFDVPARATHAERRRPTGVLGVGVLGGLPQGEITRVVLVGGDVGRVDRIVLVGTGGVHGRAHAVGHGGGLIDFGGLLLVSEFAVMRPGCHIEVHVAGGLAVRIRDHIAVSVVENALNQVDHVRHVAGGARFHGGRQHAERVVRLGEFALVVIGAGPPTLAGGRGLIEDLIVDIGHITHKSDFVTELQKPAAHDVERHGGTDMADMR